MTADKKKPDRVYTRKGHGPVEYVAILAEADLACLEHIQEAHGQADATAAARFAVLRQAVRDKKERRQLAAHAADDNGRQASPPHRKALLESAKKADGPMKRWPRRYSEDFLRLLVRVRKYHGLANKAQAFRFCIRSQAVKDGYPPEKLP